MKKKKTRQLLTFAATFSIVLGCLSGCTKKETAESILNACSKNMGKVESFAGEYSLEMEMQMSSADTGFGMDNIGISLNCDYEMTNDPQVFYQKGELGVLGFSMNLENYLVQDSSTSNTISYTNTLGEWSKSTNNTKELSEELFGVTRLLDEKKEYALEKDLETCNGKDVYVLTTTYTASELFDLISYMSDEFSAMDAQEWEFSDADIDITIKIYKDTKRLAECVASISDDWAETNDDEAEMEMNLGTFRFSVCVNEYDTVDEIQIPEEALQAEESVDDLFADYMEDNEQDPSDGEQESSASKDGETLEGEWVNLDLMQFAVNGKVYTIGETTLQEMIDDGVPFEEDDLANASNNLNKNSESQGFEIILGEYYSAQVFVMNTTDDNQVTAECCISEIYLPVHNDREQNVISFAFPLTLTEEELRANAGEPTDFNEYKSDDYVSHRLEYTRESTVYYGDWGYNFEFDNDELRYITIDWLP